MTITDTTVAFGASGGALVPAIPLSAGRTPLNVAAAQVAATLKHRFVTPAILAGLARLADFVGLVAVSVAIFSTYVIESDADDFGYILVSILLPAATVILIGALNAYAISDYRRTIGRISRAAGAWVAVFGCFTLVLFFLKMRRRFLPRLAGELVRRRSRHALRPSHHDRPAGDHAGARPACSSAALSWSAAVRKRWS